eukprot:tig00021070_g17908.t1
MDSCSPARNCTPIVWARRRPRRRNHGHPAAAYASGATAGGPGAGPAHVHAGEPTPALKLKPHGVNRGSRRRDPNLELALGRGLRPSVGVALCALVAVGMLALLPSAAAINASSIVVVPPPPPPVGFELAETFYAAVQRVYAASTDPTTKLVFGRKSELWLVVDVDDPPGIDEGEFSCQASGHHTCSVDEAAMLAQPGCSPYIIVSAPSTNATFRVPHVPRAQTPWASHHATSRLYFRHVVNDEDPVLEPLRAPIVNLANCNYITTAFGILEYITLDNTTHAPSGYFEVEPDPSNPLNADPVVDTSKRIKLDPELAPVSLQLIGAEPGTTLSVNDVMLVAITFDGVIDDPLPPNCSIAVNLNFRTIEDWQALPRNDAVAGLGGSSHATISDHTLVYRHKVLKGENSRAIAVRSPASQGLIISNECSSKCDSA